MTISTLHAEILSDLSLHPVTNVSLCAVTQIWTEDVIPYFFIFYSLFYMYIIYLVIFNNRIMDLVIILIFF